MANGKPSPRQKPPAPLPLATAEDIFAAADVKEDPAFEVPEWGRSLHLRGFALAERLEMEEAYVSKETGEEDEREKFVQYLLHGIVAPKLTEEQASKIVDEKAHHVIQRIYARIMVLNAGDTAAQRSAVEGFLGVPG